MDIVYVLKESVMDNIELRYSLRSLKNVPHRNVYIFWYKPSWVQNVIHIPIADDLPSKFQNVRRKFRMICDDKNISENFVLMHDDFYIIKPIRKIEYHSRWLLIDYLRELKRKIWSTRFYKALRWAYLKFPRWDCFSIHCPIIFNKKKLKHIMELYWDDLASKRSLYCNYYKIKWVPLKWWIKDCKIFGNNPINIHPDQEYLSSNDDIRPNILSRLEERFPKKSLYEI
jgi:hypothetical protein